MNLIFIVLLIFLSAANAFAVGSPVRIDGGDTLIVATDIPVTTTATLVSASNSNRAALNCTTDAEVRWGPSTITSTKGQIIFSNGSIEIRNTSAIYMISMTGTANVSCTEESWQSVSSGDGIFSP